MSAKFCSMIITLRQFNIEKKEFVDRAINCNYVVSVERSGVGSMIKMESGEEIYTSVSLETAANVVKTAMTQTIILSEDPDIPRNN